jgi:hypothetical protein
MKDSGFACIFEPDNRETKLDVRLGKEETRNSFKNASHLK